MKKIKKSIAVLLAMVMCFALTTPAFAADDCDSSTVTVTIEGQSYEIWSTLFRDGTRYRAATWIKTADYSKIPTDKVKVQSFLMGGSGQIAQSSLTTLSAPWEFLVAYTPYTYTTASGIYATGTAYIETSNGVYKAYPSTDASESDLASFALAIEEGLLTVDGAYHQNGEGKTYGSLGLADVVGAEPELISAIGTNGESGYVRSDELFANYDTEGYAGRYIGLYDVDGHDIGSFFINFNDASEFIGKNIDEVYALLADGRAENPELWALADEFLVNGEYPVNANGETYGDYSLRKIVGYAPDLVLAVNEDGVQGYVRHTDTPVATWSDGRAGIPLYDKEGTVIGVFGNINTGEVMHAGQGIPDLTLTSNIRSISVVSTIPEVE